MDPNPANPSSSGAARSTEGTALASLILGIAGYVGLGPLGWIPGIICGHVALGRIRSDPALTGDGIARGGLAASYVGMILTALLVVGIVIFFAFFVGAAVPHASEVIAR